mgnify:CR=1 FL=1
MVVFFNMASARYARIRTSRLVFRNDGSLRIDDVIVVIEKSVLFLDGFNAATDDKS